MIILPLFYCLVNAFAIHSGGNYCCDNIVIVLLLPPIHAPRHPARLSKTYFFLVLPPFRTPTPWARYSAAASFLFYLLGRHQGSGRGILRRLLSCFTSWAGTKALGEVILGLFLLVLPPGQATRPWARYSAASSFLLYLLYGHRCLVRGIPRRLLSCFTSCAGNVALGEVFRGVFFLVLPPGQSPRLWVRYSAAASFLFYLLCRHQSPGRGILRRLLSCFTSWAGN